MTSNDDLDIKSHMEDSKEVHPLAASFQDKDAEETLASVAL